MGSLFGPKKAPTDWRRVFKTVGLTVLVGAALTNPFTRFPTQNVINPALRQRAGNIVVERAARKEFLAGMDRQIKLNRDLHTPEYKTLFWKNVNPHDMDADLVLTKKEQDAVERFCAEHPVFPLTHVVMTVESNVPDRGQSLQDYIRRRLNKGDFRIAAVLAAVHQRTQKYSDFNAAVKKLQARQTRHAENPLSVQFYTLIVDGKLNPKYGGRLSAVHSSWTGEGLTSTPEKRERAVGTLLLKMYGFNSSLTPFFAPNSFSRKGDEWVYHSPSEKTIRAGAVQVPSESPLLKQTSRNLFERFRNERRPRSSLP